MAFGDLVQTIQNAAGSSSTASDTYTSTPTEGNLMIAVVMTGASSITTPSGWSVGVYCDNTTEGDVVAVYYKIAGASESTTVSVTLGASDEWSISIAEFEGPWDSSPVDLSEAEARDATPPSSYTMSPTGTTSVADELAIACIYTRSQSTTYSGWTNSFTERADNDSDYKSMAWASKLLTATGSVSTTVTLDISQATSIGGMVTFKKQAAGGGTTPYINYYHYLYGGGGVGL